MRSAPGNPTSRRRAAELLVATAPGWALASAAATGIAAGAWPHRWVAAVHAAAATLALLSCIARLAFDHVRAHYRASYARWAFGVALLAALLALQATGTGLVPGETGAEARAHLAAGLAPAPSAADVLAAHAFLLAPAALGIALYLSNESPRRAPRLVGAALAVLLMAAPFAAAPALVRETPVPVIEEAEAGRAPWSLRALEPLEADFGVPAAGLVMLASLAALLLLPLVDRSGRLSTRALVTGAFALLLLAYVALSLHSGFAPVSDHLHAAMKVSP